MLLPLHIIAGGIAITLGAVALLVRKGGTLHRRAGLFFVVAMVVMGSTASLLGYLKSGPTNGNVLAGMLPLYFVTTAVTTVRRPSRWSQWITGAAMIFAVSFGVISILRGVRAFQSAKGTLGGIPFPMFFFLAVIALLAAAGDLRTIRFGIPPGGKRLARHLWRMCFALFIAAGSFFTIRSRVAKILPEPFTTTPMRMLPIALVFVAMFYWLWRVRRPRVAAV